MHKGLVQGRSEVAEPVDALAVPQRLRQRAAERQGCTGSPEEPLQACMHRFIGTTLTLAIAIFTHMTCNITGARQQSSEERKSAHEVALGLRQAA